MFSSLEENVGDFAADTLGWSWLSRIWRDDRVSSWAWPSSHSKGSSGWDLSVFPHGYLLFWKNWGEITELFYYNLSDSQQIMALRFPLFFKPLASNITINGYTPEYHDDRWSEVLVSKNVLLFCSGNSLQVSTTLPPMHMWPNSFRGSPGNCGMRYICS